MKKAVYLIIIILTVSCKNKKSENNFREEIDRIKKEELPNKDYAVTSFELDTLNRKKLFSEIKNISKSGVRSIKISSKLTNGDSLIGKIKIGPLTETAIRSQKIIKDRYGDENCYYLLENHDGFYIFEFKFDGETFKKRLIKSNFVEWNEIIYEMK